MSPRQQLPHGKTRFEYIRELSGLPPIGVPKSKWPPHEQRLAARAFLSRGHAFQSAAWARADFVTVELTHVYRQDDRDMVERLQVIRTGGEIVGGLSREQRSRMAANKAQARQRLARRHAAAAVPLAVQCGPSPAVTIPSLLDSVSSACYFFNERCQRQLPVRRTANGLVIEATTLYAENIDVNRENKDKLAQLLGQPAFFAGHDGVIVDLDAANRTMRSSRACAQIISAHFVDEQAIEALLERIVDRFREELWNNVQFFGEAEASAGQQSTRGRRGQWSLKEGSVPRVLELKVAAQVMLLVNLDQGGGVDHMLVNGSRGVVSRVQKIDAIIRECEQQLQALQRDTGRQDLRGEGVTSSASAEGIDGGTATDGATRAESVLLEKVQQLQDFAIAGFTSLPYVDFWNVSVRRLCIRIYVTAILYDVCGTCYRLVTAAHIRRDARMY
eukprot:SAG25_NODE_142_length_14075_cov_38.666070_11_plen_445_part_00